MNNEKETEKICNVLNGIITYGIDEQVCGTRWKKSQVGNSSIAKVLINKGYGNVKQAVKEFAERLKINISKRLKDNIGTKYPQSTVQSFHDKAQRAVDVTITKFYGADE